MKIAVIGCRGFGKVHLNALSELRRDREPEVYVFSRTEKCAKECYKEFDAEGYFTSYEKVLNSNVDIVDLVLTSSPPWKGRGFPSHRSHHRFGITSGGQSSGSENHSHLKIALGVWGYPPQGGLSLPSSSPLKERDVTACSSHSPIKPSIELGRSVISVTERNFGKEVFKHGAIHPRPREARLSPP